MWHQFPCQRILFKALTNPIYHYVKGFYHEHKNHTDDCDSILDAYVCTEESDSQISSPDNKPLIFYLRQYEKRFRDFTEQLPQFGITSSI